MIEINLQPLRRFLYHCRFALYCCGEFPLLKHKLFASHHKSFASPGLVFTKPCLNIPQCFSAVHSITTTNIILIRMSEIITINDAIGIVVPLKFQRLINILYFIVMRMGLAVRGNEAIDTKSIKVGLIAEIATIGIIAIFKKSLIHPIPDGSTNNA